MHLKGSCHCGLVSFELESLEPYPFSRCYCSVCRKTTGGGGYAINLGGDSKTLKVKGKDNVGVYKAKITHKGETYQSVHERNFCKNCGSHLWAYSPEWPEFVHPLASAIDTPLPIPPNNVHIMLGSKANWVEVEGKEDDKRFEEYPDFSLAEWTKLI